MSSDLVLALIDDHIQKLLEHEEETRIRRVGLQSERQKIIGLRIKSDAEKVTKAKTSKPKAEARKSGGPSVKDQILGHMREASGPVTMAWLADITGAKKTTINGTLHQLKKAGQVTNTAGEGWAIASPAANHNGGAEARV